MGAGPAVMGAGYVLQAYNSYQQGQAEADAARQNAQMMALKAGFVRRQGASEAAAIESTGRKYQGAAKAALAGSGIDPTIGSAAGQVAQSGINAAHDATLARARAVMDAWGLDIGAVQEKKKATQFEKQGMLGALGYGLMGAGTIYGSTSGGKGQ